MMITRPNLPNGDKKNVLTYLYQECNGPKEVHLAAVASTLKNRFGIDWKEYTNDVGSGFPHWLSQNFPVEIIREEKDGVDQLKVRLLFPSIPEYCADIVRKAMGEKRSILKAQIPGILDSKGIKWSEHAGGKKLGDWLTDSFAQFKDSEDNYSICLQDGEPTMESDGEDEYDYPIVLNVSQEDLDEEIRQMHSFAFMGWWSNNTRKLRQYTGHKGNDEGIWRAIIAHQMAEAFMGVKPTLLDASGDEEPRIAFDTGMTTIAGEKLYCVFALNPKNVNGTMQPWIMLGFCYPGEVEEHGLGKWLSQRFGIRQENRAVQINDYQRLKEQLECLEEVRSGLTCPMRDALEDLENRRFLRQTEWMESLAKYDALWKEVDKLLAAMGWEVDEEHKEIPLLLERIANCDTDAERAKQAVEAFEAMADGVQSIFDNYHIHTGEIAVTQKDKEQVRSLYGDAVVAVSNKAFLEILEYYKSLHQVMSATALTEELDAAIEKVCQHFAGITYKTASRLLVNAEPQECEVFAEIAEIEMNLESGMASVTGVVVEKGQDHREVTAEELLDAAVCKDYEKEWNVHTLSIRPTDEAEWQIVEKPAESETMISGAYTPYAAGMRLYREVGNRNQTAEKMLLLGLCRKDYRCVSALLSLYREERRQECFDRIWNAFAKYAEANVENQIYILDSKSRDSYNQMKEYINARPYLCYMEEALPIIIRAYKEQGLLELSQKLEERLENLQAREELNAFEQVLVSNDRANIKEWTEKKETLEELGYTEREIRQIIQTATSENYVTGGQDYEIGVRILAFQGNKNGTAEQYLWKGLTVGGWGGRCVELMGVLVSGQRWEECCSLYEAYREELSSEGKSRQYYLVSLLHIGPKPAMDFIHDNLQDYLILEQGTAEVKAFVEEWAQAEDERVAEFYKNLLEIGEILLDDFTRSVVLLDRRLRDFVTQQERLLEFGVAPELVEKSSVLYKTDAYPHGADAVSIAQRVYAFIGTFKGVAEAIARFALPDYNAVSLLWEIHGALDEEEEQYQLLMDYPMLRETHWESYAVFLFGKGQYTQFLEVCRGKEEKSSLLCVQEFIAYLKTGQQESAIMPKVDDELMKMNGEWVILLAKELVIAKRLDELKEILFKHFQAMLAAYDVRMLRRVATADGELTEAELVEFQEEALEKEYKQVAIYYYNELQIGAIGEVADSYYRQETERCELAEGNDKIVILQSLKSLYREKADALAGQITLLELARLIKGGTDLKQDAQEIASILRHCELDKDGVSKLFEMLEDEAIVLEPVVYTGVEALCEHLEMERESLAFFHKLSQKSGETEEGYGGFLCELYMKALLENFLPLELVDEAAELCRCQINKSGSIMAAFCLYRMELLRGQKHRAEYALRFLADQPVDELGEDFYSIVDKSIKTYWGESLPGVLELFRAMLAESTVEEVAEYCEYCHDFIGEEMAELLMVQAKQLENQEEKSLLSEAESVEVLKLLYLDSDKPEHWELCTKLPLQNEPGVFGKILYLCSLHNPGVWSECVAYCDKYEQDDLLLQALIGWSEDESISTSLKDCRTYLEDRIRLDEDYLKRWQDSPQELLRLVEIHSRFKRTSLYETEMHAALRAAAVIALASGIPEAMDILFEKQSIYLLGEYCDLSVVIVCHLLLMNRIEEAHELLQKLNQIVSVMKYRVLVDELAGMTVEQLSDWMSGGYENRSLLNLVLPDGNAPELIRIHRFVLNSIQENRVESATKVLCRLLAVFPNDYGCYDSLFTLCKTDFEGRLGLLHKSLCGLISVSLTKSAETYYRRTKPEYAAMLAALNAVIVAGGMEREIEGYDFGEKAGDFCRGVVALGLSYDDVNTFNQLQEEIERLLANRGADEYAKISQAIICYVTGDWTDFLLNAWKKGSDIAEALSVQIEKNNIKVSEGGFARSVLRAMNELEENDRVRFLDWISRTLASEEGRKNKSKIRQMKMVRFMQERNILLNLGDDALLQEFLKYPLEEYSLFVYCYEAYIQEALNGEAEQLYARAFLIGALADYYMVQSRFWKVAKEHYEKSKDEIAAPLFLALNDLARGFDLMHSSTTTPRARQSIQEQYEIYYRLTRLFAGDEKMMEKVSSPEFHSWSCVNMAMGLLYTDRADEVLQYSQCLAVENRRLIEGLLRGIRSDISDEEKISIVRSLTDDMARAILAYVFKYSNNKTGKFFFLQSAESAKILNDIYLDMEEKRPNEIVKHCIRHFVWVEPLKIRAGAYVQKEPETDRFVEPKTETLEEDVEIDIPTFAKELLPNYEPANIDKLWEEYEKMPNFTTDEYRLRAEKAEKIYCVMLAGEMTVSEQTDILTRFGIDYYYSHAKGDAVEIALANQALKELVMLQKYSEEGGKGRKLLEVMVRTTGLHELLHKGYATLAELIADYGQNKQVFIRMRKMIHETVIVEVIDRIYEVLDRLALCYSTVAESDTAGIRDGLQKAYSMLEDISNHFWFDVKSVLQMLIRNEVNALDRRPILKIQVLNTASGKENGNLYGQVQNIGRATAEKLTIQADYGVNGISRRYELERMEPGEMAAFEINYSVAPGTTLLEYSVTTMYFHDGKVCNSAPSNGSVTIDESVNPTYPANLYDTDTVADFERDENGDITSPNFFGRTEETESLRGLFRGKNFVNYHSAILYGVRRAGKTSLLNYIKKYTEYNCPGAVTIFVSCQSINVSNCIQYIFIDQVFSEISLTYPEVTEKEAWAALIAKWTLPEGSEDRDPNELQVFYRELKNVMGKGLIFLLDEIDTLFDRVEAKQQLDSVLFPALGTILCSAACRESVHFILCGSKSLLRYRMEDGALSQLFQRLGDNVIEVGRMPAKDVREMLLTPYKDYPEVKHTDEALNWLWNYTGGLVWYTKLLGQSVIKRVKKEGRTEIYPFDVRSEIMGITRDEYCKQFYEGCEEKERLVIDAMQSLAFKQGMYIPVSKIYALLSEQITKQEITQQEVNQALTMLTSLRLVEKHPAGHSAYRFAVDIYRVYFRVQEMYVTAFDMVPEAEQMFLCKEVGAAVVSDDDDWGF